MTRLTDDDIHALLGGTPRFDLLDDKPACRALLAAHISGVVRERLGEDAWGEVFLLAGNVPADIWDASNVLSQYMSRGLSVADLTVLAERERA
ncbi:hypothetical protein [Tateyamaria sp. Alg231-49]|uniref:hypothetical protein n=1 Tax=Tateyamaria sp. Alg231-49 TaxID=1922219 RepID=UPI00131F145B|nr:hypothetical protein [Tateyamaria sp. Alg231-49]